MPDSFISRAKSAKGLSVAVLLVISLAAVAAIPLTTAFGQSHSQPGASSGDPSVGAVATTTLNASVSVDSVNQNGSSISGYYAVLYDRNGTVAGTGLTPVTFRVEMGEQHSVQVENYGACTFSHWTDGVAENSVVFNVTTASMDFTAVYNCGGAALPGASLVQQAASTCSYVCGTGSAEMTFNSSVRQGDLLAVSVVSDDLSTLNVSDSLGTFIQLGVRSASTSCDSNTGTCQADIFWGMLPSSGSDTVTVSEGHSDRALRVQAWEFGGVDGLAGGSCSPVFYPAGSVLLATGRDVYGAGAGFVWDQYRASGVGGTEYMISQSAGSTSFPFSTGVNDVEAAAVFLQAPASIECGSTATTTTTTTTSTKVVVGGGYQLNVSTDHAAYTSNSTIRISGSVSPPPAAPSNVVVTVTGPVGVVDEVVVPTNDVNGSFSLELATPITASATWVVGTYTVTATLSVSGQTHAASTAFVFTPAA